MVQERTFVMIKPDGIQRGIIAEIITRFERKGLKLVALKMIRMDKEMAEKHYAIHKGKHFYESLIDFIISCPVIVSIWEGKNAIALVRKLVGATSPNNAEPGTIRGDFVISTTCNVIHASDALETAASEMNLFFNQSEIHEYSLCLKQWLDKRD